MNKFSPFVFVIILATSGAYAKAEQKITFEKDLTIASPTDVVLSIEESSGHLSRKSCSNPVQFVYGRTYQWILDGSGNGCGISGMMDTETGAKGPNGIPQEWCDITFGNHDKFPHVVGKGTKFKIRSESTYRTDGWTVWFIQVDGQPGFFSEAFRCSYNASKPLTAERVLELTNGYVSISPEAL